MDRPADERHAEALEDSAVQPTDPCPEAEPGAPPTTENGQIAAEDAGPPDASAAELPVPAAGTDDGATVEQPAELPPVLAPDRRKHRPPLFLRPSGLTLFLIFVSFWLRVLWLDQPTGSLIFDEKYYVSAAETILGLPQPKDAAYAQSTTGKDPNPEHPPLAKLIIAGGIWAVGDTQSAAIAEVWSAVGGQNPWGWRFPSVLAGTLSIAFVYQLARRAGLKDWAALLAAYLYSFDNLVFVTSRIGILDVFMFLGILAGAAWFLGRRPVLSPVLAGLAFAFGTLCKEYGVYGVAIVVGFVIVQTLYQRPGRADVLRRAARTALMCAVFLVSFLVGLWQLDLRWSTFTNPISHLEHIWDYGTKLTHPAGPTGIESYPWEWLLNEVQIPYLKVTVTVCSTTMANNAPCPQDQIIRQYDSILFRGALNPYLLFVAPLAGAYVIAQFRARHDRTALLAMVWFAVAYLPFLPATILDHRISYIYYMLPVVPALAIASAQLFSDPRIPKSVTVGYVIAILFGFAGYFPFAGFKV